MTMTCSHVPCTRPRFHSRLRRRHRLNCHILAAIEASNSLTVSPVSIFILESRLLCVSGCRRFHDDLSGYCPHHQWLRWAKCIDWVSTAPRLGSQLRGNADPMLTQHRSQKVHKRFPTPTLRYEVLFRGH